MCGFLHVFRGNVVSSVTAGMLLLTYYAHNCFVYNNNDPSLVVSNLLLNYHDNNIILLYKLRSYNHHNLSSKLL